ncbi:gamma-glutamyltransferase [Lentzea sp. BCCO 10_0798]|uniref:Gamma-glutamyltransferase n=1 Tax=Lentzea kristufekii TaxID=3095430 RepID=A0ABU4U774_9PSEU|nr:gamma-glutamyltransferase [Lentzea sp. BCCO 10_0798]MDX8056173.1 gamma-glutamyltransferase [Lentzea sp. BCCO 10_0798]
MTLLSAVLSLALTASVLTAPAPGAPRLTEQTGSGGAVSSVDPDASAVGVEVLRRGGNAVDAAVATAAALGVTDPFSTGIAGGGFFVHYQASTRRVSTIDGRETAPAAVHEQLFVENGAAIAFDEAMTSGLSVGVPGNPATWRHTLARWGTLSLGQALAPAEAIARRGFVVDETFHRQVANNAGRFADFTSSRKLFLPGGKPPAVGSTFRNPELADTYRELARTNLVSLYGGSLGRDVVRTVRQPPVAPGSTRVVHPGRMTIADLAAYRVTQPAPARTSYRGLDVYSAAAPAGGLSTGEALNILETTDLAKASQTEYLHRFMEATKLAFADRTRWVGDPSRADVPAGQLLSQRYADSRACLIRAGAALPAPTGAGDPRNPRPCAANGSPAKPGNEAERTTHLVVTDRWGNAVSYTSTIESEGGNGIVVPGRGFLLNNELTDFNFVPALPGGQDPNLPGACKRPRSAMSPVIVLDRGRLVLAAGSPGGGTIITTVTQILAERYGRGRTLLEAVATPRVSQRNTAVATAEPVFLASSDRAALESLGHRFGEVAEIGAATAIERLPDGRWQAVAEPVRRGGGAARVVNPS